MPTYVYETVEGGGELNRFEIRQSIHDAPLKHHPETGAPVRRVISGGLGLLKVRSRGSHPQSAHASGCCPGCHD